MLTKNQKSLLRSHWGIDAERRAGPCTRDSGRRAFMNGNTGTRQTTKATAYMRMVVSIPYREMSSGIMRGKMTPPVLEPAEMSSDETTIRSVAQLELTHENDAVGKPSPLHPPL